MQRQPLAYAGYQPPPAMVRWIKTSCNVIHQPILIRCAGCLPLQQPFSGQAAAQLDDNLRLSQLAHRAGVAQPQIGTGQRLPGLGEHVANQGPAQHLRPLCHPLALGGAHPPGHHNAALLSPEEPVALLLALATNILPQPGTIALPPAAQCVLPLKARIIQLAVERLGKGTVDMYRPTVQRSQRVIQRGDQPAGRDLLGRTWQRDRLCRMRGKHARLADRLIGPAVDKLRRTIGGKQDQLFTGQPGLNQRRIEVRHRRSGGDNYRDRLLAGLRQPERQMSQPALVEMGMVNKRFILRSRQGERRRAGAGRDANVSDAVARQRFEDNLRPAPVE